MLGAFRLGFLARLAGRSAAKSRVNARHLFSDCPALHSISRRRLLCSLGFSVGIRCRRRLWLSRQARRSGVPTRSKRSEALVRLGAVLCRAGAYDRASKVLQEAHAIWDRSHLKPLSCSAAYLCYFPAMRHQQLGNHDEATTWYDRATDWADKKIEAKQGYQPIWWNPKLTLELLRKEAEHVLGIEKSGNAGVSASKEEPR